jgi:hypothetical protein
VENTGFSNSHSTVTVPHIARSQTSLNAKIGFLTAHPTTSSMSKRTISNLSESNIDLLYKVLHAEQQQSEVAGAAAIPSATTVMHTGVPRLDMTTVPTFDLHGKHTT